MPDFPTPAGAYVKANGDIVVNVQGNEIVIGTVMS